MKSRLIITLTLVLTLIFSLAAPVFAADVSDFTDVKTDAWYYEAVDFVVSHGLFAGTTTSSFSPEQNVTRGMLVTILGRFAGIDAKDSAYQAQHFSDVSASEYYAPYISWAYLSNIVQGESPSTFGPNNAITRQDLVTILHRYALRSGGGDVSSTNSINSFPDKGKVAAYALQPMCWAVENDIVNGSGGLLDPTGFATRAQVAQLFYNAFDILGEGDLPEVDPPVINLGRFTCFYDADGFVLTYDTCSWFELYSDNTFIISLNTGDEMTDGRGTWRTYSEDGYDYLAISVTSASWSVEKDYIFYIDLDGDLWVEDSFFGIHPDDSILYHESNRDPHDTYTSDLYICYEDFHGFEYDSEYVPVLFLDDDYTFQLDINTGEGMTTCFGTWAKNSAGLITLTVTTDAWNGETSYSLLELANGDLSLVSDGVGITVSDSIFSYVDTYEYPY